MRNLKFSQPYLSSGNFSVYSFLVIAPCLLNVLCPALWGLNMSIYSLLFSKINIDFCSLWVVPPSRGKNYSHFCLPELLSLILSISQNLVLGLGSFSLYHHLENTTRQKAKVVTGLTWFSVLCCILSNIWNSFFDMFCIVL